MSSFAQTEAFWKSSTRTGFFKATILVCVPVDSTFPYYSNVGERDDLPEIVFQQIEHFFTHYKDLEKKKWVRIGTWGGAEDARRITLEAIERYQAAKKAA